MMMKLKRDELIAANKEIANVYFRYRAAYDNAEEFGIDKKHAWHDFEVVCDVIRAINPAVYEALTEIR